MVEDDILYLPAHRLRALFVAKELSPLTVVEMALRRAAAAQKRCNCLTQIFDKWSLAAARLAEDHYQRGTARPLEGIPLLIKSEAALQGSKQDYGSLLYKGSRDKTTDVHIARLLAAGAIPVAKSTVPEFSLLGTTHSILHGITTNPWNDNCSPGGSSGGSGAALALGVAPLATGSDIGGSIRIPAAWSGVVGFKPPYGRVPQRGPWGLDYYCHLGPMARSVRDIALMMDVMAGIDLYDPVSLRDKPDYRLPERVDLKKGDTKIALIRNWGGAFAIDPEIEKNMMAMADGYRQLGAVVEEVDVRLPRDFFYLVWAHTSHVSGASLGELVRGPKRHLFTPYAQAWGDFYHTTTGHDYFLGEEMTVALAQSLAPIFERYQAIMTPTTAAAALPPDYSWRFEKITVRQGGKKREKLIIKRPHHLGPIFNSQSRCPVVAMPSGFITDSQVRGLDQRDAVAKKKAKIKPLSARGMPTGVQLVGRPFCDVETLTLALAYEQTQDWYGKNKRPSLG